MAVVQGIEAVAHPEEPLAAGRTVVWSPLFQAAWVELHAGRDLLRVEPPNPLMERLDGFKWVARAVLPEAGWKVWAGPATADFIAQANREAAALTGTARTFAVEPVAEGRVALGLLERSLDFTRVFYRSQQQPMVFRSQGQETPVRFFGVRGKLSELFRATVRVLNFGAGSHALRIAGSNNEAAVLYRPAAAMDFAAACARLRHWLEAGPEGEYGSRLDPNLHAQDDVRIPLVRLKTENDFLPRLQGARFYPNEPLPWRMAHARQWVKFDLKEKGAEIKVRVEAVAEPFGESPKPPKMVARRFFYDGPFFVFLWREGAEWPYFGAWIGDATALEAFP